MECECLYAKTQYEIEVPVSRKIILIILQVCSDSGDHMKIPKVKFPKIIERIENTGNGSPVEYDAEREGDKQPPQGELSITHF